MKWNKGFTLIEVLVATAITTIAGSLLFVIMVNSLGLYSHQSSKVQTSLDINDALSYIRAGIKQASSIAVSYTDGGTTYTTGASQLVFKVASIDSSGSIVSDTYDFFVVFANNQVLRFKVFPGPGSARGSVDRVLSASLNSLTFQYLNNANPPVEVAPTAAKRIRISLSLKQKIGLSSEESIATTEANLRND